MVASAMMALAAWAVAMAADGVTVALWALAQVMEALDIAQATETMAMATVVPLAMEDGDSLVSTEAEAN